jgi:hypothetical protein
MQELFHRFQILKAIVEDGDQLKTKDGLNILQSPDARSLTHEETDVITGSICRLSSINPNFSALTNKGSNTTTTQGVRQRFPGAPWELFLEQCFPDTVGRFVPDRRSAVCRPKSIGGGLLLVRFLGLTRHWHTGSFGGPRRTRPTSRGPTVAELRPTFDRGNDAPYQKMTTLPASRRLQPDEKSSNSRAPD